MLETVAHEAMCATSECVLVSGIVYLYGDEGLVMTPWCVLVTH